MVQNHGTAYEKTGGVRKKAQGRPAHASRARRAAVRRGYGFSKENQPLSMVY
jgi:hypothetical protein